MPADQASVWVRLKPARRLCRAAQLLPPFEQSKATGQHHVASRRQEFHLCVGQQGPPGTEDNDAVEAIRKIRDGHAAVAAVVEDFRIFEFPATKSRQMIQKPSSRPGGRCGARKRP
jgi:hypothetical protein